MGTLNFLFPTAGGLDAVEERWDKIYKHFVPDVTAMETMRAVDFFDYSFLYTIQNPRELGDVMTRYLDALELLIPAHKHALVFLGVRKDVFSQAARNEPVISIPNGTYPVDMFGPRIASMK